MTPIDYVALASAIAQGMPHVIALLRRAGCEIASCPADYDGVTLAPADLPDAAGKMRDARTDALHRTSGR